MLYICYIYFIKFQVRIDKTTINLQLQVSYFCNHHVNR